MGGLVRLILGGFVVLTAIYVILSIMSRRARRRELILEWDAGAMEGDKEAWISANLQAYDHSLRRKLILGVYVVPLAVIGTIIYVVNYS
ncbi:MAG: hypothetical protein NTX73_04875 [Rhodobacterales bacterium]|jgi:hypothetical protein|nr:hypothetical protein [Rhodobacterales bacterium]